MFYLFIFILCCVNATDEKYKGFNKITIEILNVHEEYSGWFTEIKET